MTVIDGIVMRGRRIIVPTSLQQRALEKLRITYMGLEKTKSLKLESKCYQVVEFTY